MTDLDKVKQDIAYMRTVLLMTDEQILDCFKVAIREEINKHMNDDGTVNLKSLMGDDYGK